MSTGRKVAIFFLSCILIVSIILNGVYTLGSPDEILSSAKDTPEYEEKKNGIIISSIVGISFSVLVLGAMYFKQGPMTFPMPRFGMPNLRQGFNNMQQGLNNMIPRYFGTRNGQQSPPCSCYDK